MRYLTFRSAQAQARQTFPRLQVVPQAASQYLFPRHVHQEASVPANEAVATAVHIHHLVSGQDLRPPAPLVHQT